MTPAHAAPNATYSPLTDIHPSTTTTTTTTAHHRPKQKKRKHTVAPPPAVQKDLVGLHPMVVAVMGVGRSRSGWLMEQQIPNRRRRLQRVRTIWLWGFKVNLKNFLFC
jgi:hypothetical protein